MEFSETSTRLRYMSGDNFSKVTLQPTSSNQHLRRESSLSLRVALIIAASLKGIPGFNSLPSKMKCVKPKLRFSGSPSICCFNNLISQMSLQLMSNLSIQRPSVLSALAIAQKPFDPSLLWPTIISLMFSPPFFSFQRLMILAIARPPREPSIRFSEKSKCLMSKLTSRLSAMTSISSLVRVVERKLRCQMSVLFWQKARAMAKPPSLPSLLRLAPLIEPILNWTIDSLWHSMY